MQFYDSLNMANSIIRNSGEMGRMRGTGGMGGIGGRGRLGGIGGMKLNFFYMAGTKHRSHRSHRSD